MGNRIDKRVLRLVNAAIFLVITFGITPAIPAQKRIAAFRVIVIAEADGGVHQPYVDRAVRWLDSLAAHHHLSIDYISSTDSISAKFLARYQLFIQLNYPPYRWTDLAKKSFRDYITSGKGGWIGFHHATLLGEFDGYEMWPWFSEFMGGIRFRNYIAAFASAEILNEPKNHPVMKGVPGHFRIERDEFYTWDKSPRGNVTVLASADESTYSPMSRITMGDHPVIWTNPHYAARNVYIFMGHGPWLFDNPVYTRIFTNAIFWAAGADKGDGH